ncbi:YccF domain-containing protein [Corynebacterium epidermidicanis]|uniref:Putative membrane protein n=1 Tax=Corynebacterium epidermidicanis TaxID=1050174 RepID=A0A0G3GUZ1_9CORY|nr:YccF domain-containing protein [Corynebacterium epidermidicanis]AKK02642.1 putative membrane protein [Corynebacterium epidermidicanis]
MKTLLNIVWFLFGGFWLALSYYLAGIVACLFIVTIPAGVASFRIANYMLWPFGRTVVAPTGGGTTMGAIANVIWFLVAGVWLAINHVITACALAVTIVGIPFAWANIKLIPITCFPFGKQIVSGDRIPFGYEPMIKM